MSKSSALSLFHYIWLRDCCQCPACRHPCSQERLLDTSAVPLSVAADKVALVQDGGGLEITWDKSQFGHKSVFTAEWLREHCYTRKTHQHHQKPPEHKVLWDAKILNNLPEISYEEVMNEVPISHVIHLTYTNNLFCKRILSASRSGSTC